MENQPPHLQSQSQVQAQSLALRPCSGTSYLFTSCLPVLVSFSVFDEAETPGPRPHLVISQHARPQASVPSQLSVALVMSSLTLEKPAMHRQLLELTHSESGGHPQAGQSVGDRYFGKKVKEAQ